MAQVSWRSPSAASPASPAPKRFGSGGAWDVTRSHRHAMVRPTVAVQVAIPSHSSARSIDRSLILTAQACGLRVPGALRVSDGLAAVSTRRALLRRVTASSLPVGRRRLRPSRHPGARRIRAEIRSRTSRATRDDRRGSAGSIGSGGSSPGCGSAPGCACRRSPARRAGAVASVRDCTPVATGLLPGHPPETVEPAPEGRFRAQDWRRRADSNR